MELGLGLQSRRMNFKAPPVTGLGVVGFQVSGLLLFSPECEFVTFKRRA